MLKSYEELRNIDVLPYCEKRKVKDEKGSFVELDYLNWAKCIDLLHTNGAKVVYFSPLINSENGSSLFMTNKVFADKNGNTNSCYEVGVHIVIDDLEFDMRGPLMNGSNPVKDNSLSQQRVWNCQARLFVKGVAIHTGLGFNLWLKNEQEEETQTHKNDSDNLAIHSLKAIKTRITEKLTEAIKNGHSAMEIANNCGFVNEDEMRVIFTYFSALKRYEDKLNEILKNDNGKEQG